MCSRARRGAALVFALESAGCAELGEPRFVPAVGTFEIVETIPADGALGIDPLVRVDVCLSEIVDPRSLDDFAMTLHSGALTFDGQIEVQLVSWREPGGPGLANSRWCPGSVVSLTPHSPLEPGLNYRARLQADARGWAGESFDLDQEGWFDESTGPVWTIAFTIAGQPGDAIMVPEPDPGPSLTELFAPTGPFDPERAMCSCHLDVGSLAHARLDLSTPELAWDQLVAATAPAPSGFPWVNPGEPSTSGLVHELVRTHEGAALEGIDVAMPPDAPLPFADLVRINHWIADGARLD